MSIFGAIVRTTINIVTLPVAVAKDVLTLGNCANCEEDSYTIQKLQQIKDEAED